MIHLDPDGNLLRLSVCLLYQPVSECVQAISRMLKFPPG
jgi:hypothetical protein